MLGQDHREFPSKAFIGGSVAALPCKDLPAFVNELRQRQSMAALALEFCILTAAMSGEVLGAQRHEIDRKAFVWTIPAERMKAGKEHRAPLVKRAVAILKDMKKLKSTGPIFPSKRKDQPLSSTAMAMQLRRMNRSDITVHGFRSSFRDRVSEEPHFPREIAEHALAHGIEDKTEAAYRRGEALEKRRDLTLAWDRFVGSAISPI